jgi:hypothetical protein
MELNVILGPVETRKLSFRSYISVSVYTCTGCLPWQNLTQKIAILHPRVQTDSGRVFFVLVVHGAGVRRATYLCLDSTKKVDNINVSFIIYVTFDHAWAEGTLSRNLKCNSLYPP